jgi:hypothetical protein
MVALKSPKRKHLARVHFFCIQGREIARPPALIAHTFLYLVALETAVQNARGKLERAQGAQDNAEKDYRE